MKSKPTKARTDSLENMSPVKSPAVAPEKREGKRVAIGCYLSHRGKEETSSKTSNGQEQGLAIKIGVRKSVTRGEGVSTPRVCGTPQDSLVFVILRV